MLTKNQIKLIKSLQDKKYRNEYGLFVVEGAKSVLELLKSDFTIKNLFTTEEFSNKNFEIIEPRRNVHEIVTQAELEKISFWESNDSALAIVAKKDNNLNFDNLEGITVVLDEIRDPGNLGTIIRIADWYGVKNIIASPTTTDFYNPKVISATMGSFTRINISYTDLRPVLENTKLPVIGAFLDGDNVHTMNFPKTGFLVMGNESNGISPDIEKLVTQKATIPSFGQAESLNVAIATGIMLDNWKRKINSK